MFDSRGCTGSDGLFCAGSPADSSARTYVCPGGGSETNDCSGRRSDCRARPAKTHDRCARRSPHGCCCRQAHGPS